METIFSYVYILFSEMDKKLYVGYTANLKERLGDHFHGRVASTKKRRPLVLIHYEAFRNRIDAKAREEFLKSGFGRSQLKKALQHILKDLEYKHLE